MAKLALLIGITEYGESELLPWAAQNVYALARTLRDPELGGFDRVRDFINPGLLSIHREIEDLFNNRDKDDLVLLYFSGHVLKRDKQLLFPLQSKITDIANSSIPIASLTNPLRSLGQGSNRVENVVEANFVSDRMQRSQAKQQVAILDCSNSGTFAEGGYILSKGQAILTSLRGNQKLDKQNEESSLSIYTRLLVEGITTGSADLNMDGWITIDELHRYVESCVRDTTTKINPQFYALEADDIRVARSPLNLQRYRHAVERRFDRGKISLLGQRFLEELRERLGLSVEEARRIQEEILQRYRRYREALVEAAEQEFPWRDSTLSELADLQSILGLKDEDVALIQREVEAQFASRKGSLSTQRSCLLVRVKLENIRAFEQLDLSFEDGKSQWIMLLGNNAAGKTTFLRSLALGLCNESDAVALMRDTPGNFIRQGAEAGKITLTLRDPGEPFREYSITTHIQKSSGGGAEIIRQETEPEQDFPWSSIFICGYGVNRSARASASYESYQVLDAVRSLFDYEARLQNPELVLLRLEPEVREILERKLLRILMLDAPENQLNYGRSGLGLQGPWGKAQLSTLSDGYRCTSQWILDFLSWAIYANRLHSEGIGGILLIDEIEQHLHPRWQRYIVQRLQKQFPKTQIIATTHTPLVASGIVDVQNSMLVKLEQQDNGSIDKHIIDKATIAGKRADQVLTSEAFGLLTTRNPGSEDDFDRYAELVAKTERTPEEESEMQALASRLKEQFATREGYVARLVERAIERVLDEQLENINPEFVSLETQRQIQEIFDLEDNDEEN